MEGNNILATVNMETFTANVVESFEDIDGDFFAGTIVVPTDDLNQLNNIANAK